VLVSADGQANLVQAMRHLVPHTTSALYWASRLTLVSRMEDQGPFDAVFAVVFGDARPEESRGVDPLLSSSGPKAPGAGTVRQPGGRPTVTETLPWVTPRSLTAPDDADASDDAGVAVPEVLPSRLAAVEDQPFDEFDEHDLRMLGLWLETSVAQWPRRRSLRFEASAGGKRIDLRATMNSSRATGFESVTLARTRPRRRPRRIVLACDVSRSMQPYAAIYLHLMRAVTRVVARQNGIRPEVFAFSTSLTRLTSVLSHRSAEVALEKANANVTDRYGGTSIGTSVAALLARPHGNALRGAVVIIASDGWDSDPPDVLARAMARLRRRAALVVWLNPRAAQRDFQPLAGSLAAALPYCDLFLPANSLAGVRQLLRALTGTFDGHRDHVR
jgi:hypothetical protein